MSEEKVEEEVEPETKQFVVSCKVVPAVPDGIILDVLDVVTAKNEEEAKDYVAGIIADLNYVVEKWHVVTEAKVLRDTAGALSP